MCVYTNNIHVYTHTYFLAIINKIPFVPEYFSMYV